MNSAIILAGGKGERYKSKTPKQFGKLRGKEILSFSVSTFKNHPKIDEIIIVTSEEWYDHVSKNYSNCIVAIGGKTRRKSCENGFLSCNKDSKNILIHDAARPMVSNKIISICIKNLNSFSATSPALASTDSIVYFDKEQYKNLNRKNVFKMQTPQGFKRDILKKILNSNEDATDEIGTFISLFPNDLPNIFEGEKENLKITTQDDIDIISNYIS
tara:strand:+ start:1380 stop:2024 length:645 start_codon:yes stop_codon:yes gene_type:complete